MQSRCGYPLRELAGIRADRHSNQRQPYTVYVAPNPLLGLNYDSAYLRDFLHTISGPIILVGHSYGGAVITNAATGDKQVKALVYVYAFAPAKGQTPGQLVSAQPGSCVLPAANVIAQPYPGAPAGAVDVYIKQSAFPSCMANGLPKGQALVLAATQRPLTSIALSQKSGVPAWKTIPSWAVIGTADHAIPPAELVAMAKQAHAHITFAHGAPQPLHDLRPWPGDPGNSRGNPRHDLTGTVPPESGLNGCGTWDPPAGAVGPISQSGIQGASRARHTRIAALASCGRLAGNLRDNEIGDVTPKPFRCCRSGCRPGPRRRSGPDRSVTDEVPGQGVG